MALKQLKNKGTVYKANDGYWRGTVRYSDEQGNLKRKAFSAKTKKLIQKKIKDYITEFQSEISASDETRKTLEESMRKWFEVFKYPTIEKVTYDHFENRSRLYIFPQIGQYKVTDITAPMLKELLDSLMNKGYSHSTVKHVYCILNQYFRYLSKEDIITKNPMENVSMIKKANFLAMQGKEYISPRDKITIFKDNEILRLKEEALKLNNSGTYKHKQAAAYILMLNTGIRTGEALGIINSDVDLENRMLHIKRSVKEVKKRNRANEVIGSEVITGNPKTPSSKRVVPLNETAIKMIKLLRQECYFGENSPLIPNKDGTSTKPSAFRSRWNYLLNSAGIEAKGLHSLRHTFATVLINGRKNEGGRLATLTLRQVADILGHSTSVITERYYVKREPKDILGITNDFNF